MKKTAMRSNPSVPKYQAVADQLEAQIANETYRIGDRLPSERELAAEWGITAMTVRQAMDLLREKSLIVRRQGHGTFVAATATPDEPPAQQPRNKPVYLLGLSPTQIAQHSQVNWQPRLRRFQGIVDAAFRRGIMIQSDVPIDFNTPPQQLVEALSTSAGLILHEESLPVEVLAGLADRGLPMVAINCYYGISYCMNVTVDSRRAAMAVVNHLIGLGHRRIAIVVGDTTRVSMRSRLDGYLDALRLAGITERADYTVIETRGSSETAAEACRQLMALDEPPTAIFAVSDRRAFGVLEAASELGLCVPQDLSVLGFDDLPEATVSRPPLTTLHNPRFESGEAAIALLIEGRGEPTSRSRVQYMEAPLVVRESTAAPRHP